MSNAQADNEELAAPPRAASVYSGAPFTLFLTVLNVLVFAGEVAMTWSADGFAGPELANALFAIPGQVAMAFGSNYGTATLYEGRIDTLVASCFVHFGVLHLAFNLYALRQIGPFLEHEVGTGRTSVLYLGSGIVGSMVSAIYRGWFLDRGISAGASGAVCGLIGATLVVGFRTQGWRSPLMRAMGLWLVVTLIIGLSGGIDNAAHGGGAVAGGLIALLWKRGGELPVLRTLSVVATVGTILAAGIAVVYYDATRPFVTMTVEDRLEYAEQALGRDDCREAWAAAKAARRIAPRVTDVLKKVQRVRARCGNES